MIAIAAKIKGLNTRQNTLPSHFSELNRIREKPQRTLVYLIRAITVVISWRYPLCHEDVKLGEAGLMLSSSVLFVSMGQGCCGSNHKSECQTHSGKNTLFGKGWRMESYVI